MSNLIFAFMQAYGGNEREALLLARSFRKFGGALANRPLWMMMPQEIEQVSESTLEALGELGVQIHRFAVPKEALNFWFGGKVYAAAAAEALASNQKADVLVWMDSDTVFTGEPYELMLSGNISMGYRPVMLKNISLLFDESLNQFWNFIYERCNTPIEHIFPMLTTVDGVSIRPQFNAGIMSVRTERSLLQSWRENFSTLYLQPELTPFYAQNVLNKIFVHQSILAATLLAKLSVDEIHDMGTRINFPMFLEAEPKSAYNVATLRYDEFKFFDHPDWEKKVFLNETLTDWLRAQVQH